MFELTDRTSLFLNIVRGFSAQAVLFGHCISVLGIKFPFFGKVAGGSLQHIGVTIFFVLSGFLIAHTVHKKRDYNFKTYLFDRFVRIYVVYLPSIAFVLIVDWIANELVGGNYIYQENYSILHVVYSVLMLQDFPIIDLFCSSCVESLGTGRPFWSLAVEWWLYVFYGFIIFVLLKGKLSIINWVVFIIISLSPVFHLVSGISVYKSASLSWFWFAGVFSFYAQRYLSIMPYKMFFLFVFCALTFFRFYITGYAYDTTFGLLMATVTMISIAICQSSSKTTFVYYKKLAAFLADYSFTLYLIHYSILLFIVNVSQPSLIGKFGSLVLAIVVSNIVSIVFAYFTEMKYKKLRSFLKQKILYV